MSILKSLLVLFVIASVTHHSVAIEPNEMALNAAKGSLQQLFGEVVYYDAVDCYTYVNVVYNHVVTAWSNMFVNFPTTLENIGLIVHKSPVVFNQCWKVWNDTTAFNTTIQSFNSADIYFNVFKNTFFNFIDIYKEL